MTAGSRYQAAMASATAVRAIAALALARCKRIHGSRPRTNPPCRPCETMAEHTLWIVLDDPIVRELVRRLTVVAPVERAADRSGGWVRVEPVEPPR